MPASATLLEWDADGIQAVGGGGAGWATSLPQWYGPSGYSLWNNAALDDALFQYAAGTVTMERNQSLHNITFNVSGYIIGASTGYGSIVLGGTTPTITVTDPTGVATTTTATITAPIAGTGGLTKAGPGILVLSNNLAGVPYIPNSYAGDTTVNAGTLRLTTSHVIPDGVGKGNVSLAAGTTLEFSAAVSETINGLSGAGTVNATTATATLYVGNNDASGSFSGAINGALNLVKIGAGTETLTGTSNYTGTTTLGATGSTQLRGGTVELSGASGRLASAAANTLGIGSTLRLSNTSAANNADRLGAGALTMAGASLELRNDGSNTAFSESVGALTLASGGSTIRTDQAGASGTSTLTLASLARSAGGTVNFVGTGLGVDARNKVVFTTAPTVTRNLIGGWATVSDPTAGSYDFATYASGSVTALTTYDTGPESGWTNASNVKLTSGTTTVSSTPRLTNSLNFAQTAGTTLDVVAGQTLRVESGGILVSGAYNASITNGTLTAGSGDNTAGELVIHQYSANPLTISSTIADNGTGQVRLTTGGTGVTILSGTQLYSGATVINGGTLQLTSPSAAPTTPVATNLLYWLDASNLASLFQDSAGTIPVTASGQPVGRMNDLSGNGRNFIQATAGRLPTYITNSLNGLAVVRFDGTDDRLGLAATTDPRNVYIVDRVNSGGGLAGIWGLDGGAGTGDKGIRLTTTTAWSNPGDGNDFTNGAGGAMYINGGLNAGNASFGSVGTAHLLEAYRGTNATSYTDTQIGWYYNARVVGTDIAEVLVYGPALSGSNRIANENYLLAKWFNLQPGVLPSATAVTLNAGTLDVNGVNQTIGSLAGAAGSTVALGGGTLTVGLDGTSTAYGGTITGNGNLVKTGTGALALLAPNSYIGSTTINGGVLAAQDAAALSTSAVTVNTGGELAISNLTFSNAMTLNTGGTLSARTYIPPAATPPAGATPYTTTITGPLTVAGNANVAVRDYAATGTGAVINLMSNLTGSGNLTINGPTGGSGTLILAGNNSGYSGNYTVNNLAVLELLGSQARGTGAVTLGSGGTVRTSVDQSQTSGTLGPDGVSSWYYNFGSSVGNSNRFASDLLVSPARVFSRTDPNINWPWGAGTSPYGVGPAAGYPFTPVPNYSGQGVQCGALSRGIFNVGTAGAYTFYAGSDDPGFLYIDGLLVASPNVNEVSTSPLTLAAGWHSIVMRFTQGGGGAGMTAYYAGPDTSNNKILVGGIAGTLKTGSLTPFNLGPLTLTAGTGTVDMAVDTTASSLTMASGTTLQTTSPGLYALTVSGATTLGGNVNINAVTGSIAFNGAIGQTAASTVTINGGYLVAFNAPNTYTGLTTVSFGELDLNATGGNAIGTGGLTINAGNGDGLVSNVRLLQSNQIADASTVTLQNSGVLDLGANNETIGNLVLDGVLARVVGAGTLTASIGTSTFSRGAILANLAGAGTLAVSSASSRVVLGGNNTYTGATNVTAGALQIRSSNALGAVGAGTTISSGAALEVLGGITSSEPVTINGSGIVTTGALRNIAGSNTLAGTVTLGSASTIESGAGNLTLASFDAASNALTLQGMGDITFSAAPSNLGTVSKSGTGAVVFGYDVLGAIPAATWTWNAGVLGFSGTQTLGAVTIGTTAPAAATTWRFNSDPGAGTTITVPTATTMVAGYAADQTLLSRIAGASAGTLALAVDSANPLDFTALPNLSLGSGSLITYSGTLTPGAAGYNLGGGGGAGGGVSSFLTVTSALTGANALNVRGNLTLPGPNTFTGAVTLNAGTTRLVNNDDLGNPANVVTLNGGTIQLANTSESAGGLYVQVGNVVGGGARTIVVGAGGGTIDVPARSSGLTGAALTGVNCLTGSGTLTKTGLGFLFLLEPTNFSGNLVIAPNGNQFDIRSMGALPNVASTTIGQSAYLNVDNQNQLMTRQYPGGATAGYQNDNRFNDAATISLQGGRLMYVSRNVGLSGTSSREIFGATTVAVGQSEIRAERAGGGGSDLIISNLIHNYGDGTVRFTAGNTIGQGGDNGRITLQAINGVPTPANPTPVFVGGWAVVNTGDFAAHYNPASLGAAGGVGNYGGTGFPAYTALTTTTTPGLNGWATGSIGSAAADCTLGTPGAAQNFVVGALRLAGGATRQILFANTTNVDTLYVESGGILSDGSNNARNFGATTSAFTRGRLTAGPVGVSGNYELFLHNNASTMTINSVIIDNPAGGSVRVVKDLDAQVNLTATNLYTGGTLHLRGTLEAQAAQSLGLGPVTVKNSRLNLNIAGTIGAAAASGGFTILDQGEIYLNSNSQNFSTTWDRFTVPAGGTLIGQNNGAINLGLNSITRVSTFTAGGQAILAPDAIVGHTAFFNDPYNGVGDSASLPTGLVPRSIKNLGTNADLYFGMSGDANAGVYTGITVGSGTPWKGISTDRNSRSWFQGTITANSDFYLQGLLRENGLAVLNLGGVGNHIYSIVNNAGKPINAYVIGQVTLNDDVSPSMPGDLTFVVTPGAILQPNYSNSLGSPSMYPGSGYAKVLVQAGGTLDPGNFVSIGFAANQPYNVAYPNPGPLNGGLVTIEAGGRIWINDASGIGSGQAGNITMKTDSIMHLGHANAFFGSDPVTRMINPGQFVYEPGAIIRMETSNVYKMSQFVSAEPNGDRVVYEVYNGDRMLTSVVNPFIFPAPGSVLIAPENITIANGGMITNDSNDRTLQEGRGRLILGNGAILAGTNQTYMNIQEGMEFLPNATITIGTTRWVDGNPKLGAVQFTGPNSNTGDATNTVVVTGGAQLSFGALNVFPDTAALSLPGAVTNWPVAYNPPSGYIPPNAAAIQPGNGSILMLNAGTGSTNAEVIGTLTGNGGVMGNTGAFLGVGWGATSDFTFNGVFKSTNGQNPGLVKVGSTKMTLTGSSDSLGEVIVAQGELAFAGATGLYTLSGAATARAAKSGTLTLDNSSNAVNNRLGGANRSVAGQGGTINLIGNNTTPVTETIGNLYNGGTPAGSLSFLNVTPGAATTTFGITTIENFNNAGNRFTTWVFRTPTMGNLPGTYDGSNNYTPNPGNLTNGLIRATTPNLWGASGVVGSGIGIAGSAGTPVASTRPDLLGDTSPTGLGLGFVTQDVSTLATVGFRLLTPAEYAGAGRDNMSTNLNVRLTGSTTTSGDTRFQTLTMTPGSTLNITGTLPYNLTPSRLFLNSPGVFVQSGGAATIGGTGYLQAPDNCSLYLHTQGNLNLNAIAYSTTGIVKTGAGTLNIGPGAASIWRGTMTIDDGTVNLAANNSFMVTRGQYTFRGQNLNMNGGTLDLGGNSQIINALNSANWLPYGSAAGGTITSASPATLTVQTTGTFSGVIAGALNFDKVDNTTIILTNNNTYTGTTGVRQGTVQLRDEGRFSNTSQVDINYATLLLDNGYLANVIDRVNPAAPVNMRGGSLNIVGAPGQVSQQNIATLNLVAGQNVFNSNAGGSGATEIIIGNLNRAPGSGAFATFQQNYGFVGAPGNDTTAIRHLITNLNGSPLTPTNNLVAGWAIWNSDHFATYRPGQGISYLSNTTDGYANYDSGDVTMALPWQNVNDGANRTISVSRTVNAIRNAPNAANTFTINAGQTLTIASGGLLTNNNNSFVYTGGFLTSGTNELDVFVNQNNTYIRSVITDGPAGSVSLVKAGGGNLQLEANNTYTGTTFVNAGTLTLNRTGANGTTDVAVPGNLVVHNATVNEAIAQQIRNTADVTLYSGAVLQLMNAAVTERLNSLTLINNGGGTSNTLPVVQRAGAQAGTLELTAANAITAISTNSITSPYIHANIGQVSFVRGPGNPQTIDVTGSTLSPLGLFFYANIGTVPTGVAEGGLIKTGTGLLALGGTGTGQFGNPGAATDVFNVQQGIVRVDAANALGSNFAVTTVQSGAVLLSRGNNVITGSIRLKAGSTLGTSEADATLGTATTTIASQSTLTIAGDATVCVGDYFLQGWTQGYTINLNSKLTGSANINVTGPQITNAVGTLRLGNNITDDPTVGGITAGANDYSGTITLNTNTVLLAQATATATTGNELGNATINLNGGTLALRDNNSVNYGNNVLLSAHSFINANNAGANAGNTITLGTLTVAAGTQSLTTTFTTGDNINTVNNTYRLAFSQIDGPGTFIKAGHQIIEINGYAPTFSGNLVVAGPQGIAVQPSSGLNLNAAINNIANLTVNGIFSPVASKALNVSGILEVGDNAGQVINGTNGITSGSVTGAMSIPSTATVTAATLRNNGIIGVSSGATTLVANQIQGKGVYLTVGQPISLNAPGNTPVVLNDSASATALKFAGTSTVNLNPAGGGTMSGGVEVQGGTLRVAPTAPATNPFGTSPTIRVLGFAAPTVAAATSATLQFDGGANAIVQNSSIVNSGTVKVTSGTVTLGGTLSGPGANAYVPGLLESLGGTWNAATPQSTGGYGIKLEPRMGQTNVVTNDPITGWGGGHTWVYSGQFYDADGYFSFLSNIDDNTAVLIDGVNRLQYGGNLVVSTATTVGQRDNTITASLNPNGGTLNFGMGPNSDGWHNIEIRFNNGGGGAGPYNAYNNGIHNNFGFGLNTDGTRALDGALYTRPIDPGDATLFRTPVNANGTLQLDTGTTLNLTATGASHDAANLIVSGSSGSAALNLGNGSTFAAGGVSIPSAVTLNASAISGTAGLAITGNLTGPGSTLNLGNVNLTFNSNSAQASYANIAGTGNVTKLGTGTLTVAGNGTYSGKTDILAGTMKLGFQPVGGAALWLDASDASTITKDGSGFVSQWNDKSGNVRNATQGTAGLQPLSTPNALVNGLSVMRLDGTGDLMNVDLSFLAGSNYTILAVEGRSSTKVNNYFLGTTPAANNQGLHVGYRLDTQFSLAQYGNDLNSAAIPGYSTQMFRLWTGEFDAAAGHYLYLDGALSNSNANLVGMTTAAGGMVGRGATAGYFYQGDLAEVLIYSSALSAGDRAAVEGYLKAKWFGSGATNFIPDNSPVTVALNATLDLNNYPETIGSLAGAGNVLLGTGTLTTGGNGSTTVFSGQISGGGGLIKNGAGAMTLTGNSTYTGPTAVNDGALFVDGSITSDVTVNAGRLGGSGTIAGFVTVNNAILGAGTDLTTAILNTEDLTLTSGSTFEAMLNGLAPGAGYDQVNVTGLVSIAGDLDADLGFWPNLGDFFFIIVNDGVDPVTGIFKGKPAFGNFFLGQTEFSISYAGDYATGRTFGGNDVVLFAVPEPATMVILGMGALALLRRRRSR